MTDYLHQVPHIRKGLDVLLSCDRVFSRHSVNLDDFHWSYIGPGFPGLVRIVVGQQVSTAAAKSTNEKLDKDRFRQDLGGVIEAYQQVAERLGLVPKGGIIEGGSINEQLAASLSLIDNELARERSLRSLNKPNKPRKV